MTDSTKKPLPPDSNDKPFYTRPKFIMGTIAGVIFLILIIQNSQPTVIDIFFWKATAPAALLYLVFSLIGFGVGWVVSRSQIARAKKKK